LCPANRLLIAAALGYVGAGPANNVAISWLVAIVAIVATYGWTARERRHGSTCALPHNASPNSSKRPNDTIRIETEEGQLQ